MTATAPVSMYDRTVSLIEKLPLADQVEHFKTASETNFRLLEIEREKWRIREAELRASIERKRATIQSYEDSLALVIELDGRQVTVQSVIDNPGAFQSALWQLHRCGNPNCPGTSDLELEPICKKAR
jgi:hypothetical protein